MSDIENNTTILSQKDMSDDMKLYKIFQECKSSLKTKYPNLYYALLGWQDKHIHELLEEQTNLFCNKIETYNKKGN